jgi:hypothetical protein
MTTNTKILLSVGVAGVLAFVIYKLTKRSKDRATTQEPAPNQTQPTDTTTSTDLINKLPIKYGSKGDIVRIIQARLVVEPTSGNFLKKTEEAVKEFQKQKGLKVDGAVGKETWKKIFGVDYPNMVFPNKIDTIMYFTNNYWEFTDAEKKDRINKINRYPKDLIDAWYQAIKEGKSEYYYRGQNRNWRLGQDWVLEGK